MRRFLVFLLTACLLTLPVSAQEAPKYIALTFDDGPSGAITSALLEGLAERDVNATFFLCGYRLETYGDLAQSIRANGHEIGLHGYSHDSMADMSAAAVSSELTRTRALLPECVINLMRAPGGSVSGAVRQAAADNGLAVIHWSVDPRDWSTRDTALIRQRVVSAAGDGDIILMHDMTASSVDAALQIVDDLKARGYEFLTVSQLAMLRLCQLQSGERYTRFSPKI